MTSQVWHLPSPSQEFRSHPEILQDSDTISIRYDFETASGEYAHEAMTFTGVAAFHFTSAHSCTPEQIASYDTLVEIRDSSWANALFKVPYDRRHFRIYFDDLGCYEVLASEFIPPPSK